MNIKNPRVFCSCLFTQYPNLHVAAGMKRFVRRAAAAKSSVTTQPYETYEAARPFRDIPGPRHCTCSFYSFICHHRSSFFDFMVSARMLLHNVKQHNVNVT